MQSHQYNTAYFSWLGKESMHLSHQYNNDAPITPIQRLLFDAPITPIQRAYFSGLVQNRCTYHTNTTIHFWLGKDTYHTNTTPLTFLAWYRIDAPITPIQHRLHFWLGKESMHLSHQYNAPYFSGWVKNRCTYHTNTTSLTFLAG